MYEIIEKINTAINNVVWGIPMILLILCTGIYLTIRTKFFQITKAKAVCNETIGGMLKKDKRKTKEKNAISQFQALCTALSATIGTGNITGVASAILTGGPGAVFWMWVSAFFGMMTSYSEKVLGIYYRRKNSDGEWCGGAMYYLSDGLGSKKGMKKVGKLLSVLFSIFCIFASFGIGNMTQINNISGNMKKAFGIPELATGIILMIIASLIIIGGIKRIASVTEKIVPIMASLYIIGSLTIIFTHYEAILPSFKAIFTLAFSVKAVAGGIIGTFIKKVIVSGFQRGIFSNEAGLGSSVIVHSASNVKEPVKQGMWGIFEVFFDTIIICTMTALVILTTPNIINLEDGTHLREGLSNSTLVNDAFSNTFGQAGTVFIAIAILMFSFSTVIGWSYYGTKSFEYLFGSKAIIGYKIVFSIAVIGGAVMGENLAWSISDTLNGLMAIPNLIGVISLSGIVIKITENYVSRHFKGQNIQPMLSAIPEIQKEHEETLNV